MLAVLNDADTRHALSKFSIAEAHAEFMDFVKENKAQDGTGQVRYTKYLHRTFMALLVFLHACVKADRLRTSARFKLAKARRESLERQVDELRARVAALENEPRLEYRGVYSADVAYPKNSAVTCRGGLWIALRATEGEEPGDSTAWQLAIHRPKSAKS